MFNEQIVNAVRMVPLAFAALFPVINPIGTAIILLGMTGPLDGKTRRFMAAKIAVNTLVLLMVVLLAGSYLLSFFGITIPVVQAAGGLVLAEAKAAPGAAPSKPAAISDMLFYPFTFPITVGPGGVAVTLTLSAHAQEESLATTMGHQAGVAVGIMALCVLVYLSFAYSDIFARRLGPSGIKVLLRLMAFILVCLGGEIFWNGASYLLHEAIQK